MMAEPWVLSLVSWPSKSTTSGKSLNLSVSAWVAMEKNYRAILLGCGEDDMSDCVKSLTLSKYSWNACDHYYWFLLESYHPKPANPWIANHFTFSASVWPRVNWRDFSIRTHLILGFTLQLTLVWKPSPQPSKSTSISSHPECLCTARPEVPWGQSSQLTLLFFSLGPNTGSSTNRSPC